MERRRNYLEGNNTLVVTKNSNKKQPTTHTVTKNSNNTLKIPFLQKK